MFIVKHGRLVPLQTPKEDDIEKKKEARPAQILPLTRTTSDSDISVRSKFIHFFKVASSDKQALYSQEEQIVEPDFSVKSNDFALSERNGEDERKDGEIYTDSPEHLETEQSVTDQIDELDGKSFGRLYSFDQSSDESSESESETDDESGYAIDKPKSSEEQFVDQQDQYLHKFLKIRF